MISRRYPAVLALLAVLTGILFWVAQAADSPETVEKMIKKRRIKQLQNSERYRMTPNIHWAYLADGGGPNPHVDFNSSIISDNGYAVNPAFRTYGTPPPDPTGSIAISNTSYDYQHNSSQGYQTGRLAGNDIVHFIWMYWNIIPPSIDNADRFVNYGSYTISTSTLNQGYGGTTVSLGVTARGGYCGGEVDDDNCFHAAFHQRAVADTAYTSWHVWFPTPGSALHVDDELLSTTVFGELMWPRLTIAKKPGASDVYHFVAHGSTDDTRNRLLYWRFDPDSVKWYGPVAIDSGTGLSYTLAADPNSHKVAVTLGTSREFTSGNNNVAYYESHSDGKGWINQTELGTVNKNFITNYNDPTGPQFWGHTSTRYDHSGYLHIVWDEQRVANTSYDVAIRHWSDSAYQTRPVALGYWDNEALTGYWNLHLAKVTMGIGSGGTLCQSGLQSNKNYVYVVYTQFGGPDPVSQADYSALGYYNGELYLSVSNSGGRTWAPPVNITNTKTPGCNPGATPAGGTVPPQPDSVCRSEHWATIGPEVNDIDVLFIEDNDAGGIPLGEGTWQLDRVMYMHVPGGTTDAQYVCPVIGANYAGFLTATSDCGYHAASGTVAKPETLTVMNLGNALMTGSISTRLSSTWLQLSPQGSYAISAGDPDINVTVTMSAAALTEGLYQDTILVTHPVPSLPSPQEYPIDFLVVESFASPQDVQVECGQTAQQIITAAGGCPPYTFSMVGGPGTIDPMTGLWIWPTSCGDLGPHPVYINVTDKAGQADICQFTAYVCAPVVVHCVCECHGDPLCDGVTNLQDVVLTVNVAFRGAAPAIDSTCAHSGRSDVDCNGYTDVRDVVRVINVAFRGASAEVTFCKPCDVVGALIEGIRSPDGETADSAYLRLFELGRASIGSLLDLTDACGFFSGSVYQNERSSIRASGSLPLGLIAVYLIDGILRGSPAPHYAPIILGDTAAVDPDSALALAIGQYHLWWQGKAMLPLADLRLLPFPLEGSGIRWLGPILFDVLAEGSGTEKPNSETPADDDNLDDPPTVDGPDPDDKTDSYAFNYKPKEAAGPRPYNCFDYALCGSNCWVQPEHPDKKGQQWKDILAACGYDVDNPVPCAGQCPEGKGPKIKMIFHVGPGEQPNDDNWRHAMAQKGGAAGTWGSKNGESSLWIEITDEAKFLAKHYPPDKGQTSKELCFCKK